MTADLRQLETRVDGLARELSEVKQRQNSRIDWERRMEVESATVDTAVSGRLKQIEARLTMIEADVREFRTLFKWAAMIVAGSVLAAAAKFVIAGGLSSVAGA